MRTRNPKSVYDVRAIHLKLSTGRVDDIPRAVCNSKSPYGLDTTTYRREVTCKRCLKSTAPRG